MPLKKRASQKGRRRASNGKATNGRAKGTPKLVKKLSPQTAAARDEGPRLIPLPESIGSSPPGISTARTDPAFLHPMVRLADYAMKLWDRNDKKSH